MAEAAIPEVEQSAHPAVAEAIGDSSALHGTIDTNHYKNSKLIII